jgi:LmbE family N-acetylglucosaminyl deacetylase
MVRKNTLNVLAMAAHPDDIELCCYGTLARYAERGDRVTMCVVCKGNAGTLTRDAEDIVSIRKAEAGDSAALIGAQLIMLGFGDAELFHEKDTMAAFIEVMRRVKPDVILTHPREEKAWHNDHFIVHQLTVDASLWATHQNLWFKGQFSPTEVIPAIFEWEQYVNGFDGRPTDWVDITSTYETKLAALHKHESQLRFLKEMFHSDFSEFVRLNARYRGYQAGVRYAEAFRQMNVYPRIRTARLLP